MSFRACLLALALVCLIASPILAEEPPIPKVEVSKPKYVRTYDPVSFVLSLKLLIVYNGTKPESFGGGIPYAVNNFWSHVTLLDVSVQEGDLRELGTRVYDLNRYDPVEQTYYEVPAKLRDTYAFAHHFVLFAIKARPRSQYIVILKLEVTAERVDGSPLYEHKGGTIEDAKRELGRDYYIFVNETYYWDYNNPIVHRLVESLRKHIETKYGKPIDKIPIYDIVHELINWLAYNTYYMERYDYPYFRLRASEILNRTIIVEGKRKYYGVCRHFVDVFVALARGLGVPANRYEGMVFGYVGGRLMLLGFHAWAEVYLPGVGWVPVEVTITHPFERDVIDIGDLEFVYYVPMVHEYYSYKPPLSPLLEIVLSANVSSVVHEKRTSPVPAYIYIPTLGRISVRDFLLILAICALAVDNLYLHRRLARYAERRGG